MELKDGQEICSVTRSRRALTLEAGRVHVGFLWESPPAAQVIEMLELSSLDCASRNGWNTSPAQVEPRRETEVGLSYTGIMYWKRLAGETISVEMLPEV